MLKRPFQELSALCSSMLLAFITNLMTLSIIFASQCVRTKVFLLCAYRLSFSLWNQFSTSSVKYQEYMNESWLGYERWTTRDLSVLLDV